MRNITHVYFDLDHTLWDHSLNAKETLIELVNYFDIGHHVPTEEFIRVFEKVNARLWHKYNQKEIDRNHIRKYRFAQILRTLKIYIAHKPEELSDYFIYHCCRKPGLMPGTLNALRYLKEKYMLGVITNGFSDTQQVKIDASGLAPFFDSIITSETTPYRKPEAQIFHHALSLSQVAPHQSVMIGDNPITDIRGALDVGMEAIFYNPTGHRKSVCEWQIESLDELIRIL